MTILLYSLVLACLILFPADTADAALHALQIWGTSIVPVLFPYMVFSRLLGKSMYALRLPAAPVAAVLGLLGGSPSGAAAIAANSSRLSKRSMYALCSLTGTVSPMFILGLIQSWLKHPALSRLILLCHWLSAVLCAWIVWMLEKDKNEPTAAEQQNFNLPNPVAQSIDAILQVGGYVILYSVLAGILGKIMRPFPASLPVLHAALEVSGGIHAVCQSNLPFRAKSIVLSASLGFSGLSIISQNEYMLKPVGIRMRHLIVFAVMRAALSAVIMGLLLMLSPVR